MPVTDRPSGPQIRLAPCRRRPQLDGQFRASNWAEAARLCGLTSASANVLELRCGDCCIAYDEQALYLAMRTELPPEGGLVGTGESGYDGKFDALEIWLAADLEAEPAQLWISPAGGVVSLAGNADAAALEVVSDCAAGWWVVEARLPWQALGRSGPGESFRLRPARNWRYPADWGPSYTSWAAGWGGYAEVSSMLEIIVDVTAPRLALLALGDLLHGVSDVKLTIGQSAAAAATYACTVRLRAIVGAQDDVPVAAAAARQPTDSEAFTSYLTQHQLRLQTIAESREVCEIGGGLSKTITLQHQFEMPAPRDLSHWSGPRARLYELSVCVRRESDGAVCFSRDWMVEQPRIRHWSFVRPCLQNRPESGYRGFWYQCTGWDAESRQQPWIYRVYSGGLGTYTAKHRPLAVYSPEADKTFFCYGGSRADDCTAVVHMIGAYDHRTGQVSRPTCLLDRETDDGHDNVVISRDDAGFIWAFSSSHGLARRAVISRSVRADDISEFAMVDAVIRDGLAVEPFYNFSYPQPWFVAGQGFIMFCTRYIKSARTGAYVRHPGYLTSADGVVWSPFQVFADLGYGHYSFGYAQAGKAAVMFNVLPDRGTNKTRTNLYYAETLDFGRTWQLVDGRPLTLPITGIQNAALVHDYRAEGLKVYPKDLLFDGQGHPVILHLATRAEQNGPVPGERMWRIAHWRGDHWQLATITTSDMNYDTGSLYLEDDGSWLVIGPTETGPQPYNCGGEVAIWRSADGGDSWTKTTEVTRNSRYNHTYVRRPVNPHPDFYALWADGDPRALPQRGADGIERVIGAESRLYFCNRAGKAYQLPTEMPAAWMSPLALN